MATISFLGGTNGINNLLGSGVGFYSALFAGSVAVGEFQQTTYITDSNGIIQGPQINNSTLTHTNSVTINGGGSIPLTSQNVTLRVFDRSDINNPASGVVTKVAELIHPDVVANNNGSGDTSWITPTGSSVIMDLVASPGVSGQRPNGADTTALNHDWHVNISSSPSSIGSKTLYGLYIALEYL